MSDETMPTRATGIVHAGAGAPMSAPLTIERLAEEFLALSAPVAIRMAISPANLVREFAVWCGPRLGSAVPPHEPSEAAIHEDAYEAAWRVYRERQPGPHDDDILEAILRAYTGAAVAKEGEK